MKKFWSSKKPEKESTKEVELTLLGEVIIDTDAFTHLKRSEDERYRKFTCIEHLMDEMYRHRK